MTVEPSDCLGCGFGVDSVTGLPSFLPDPNGNLECGPNGAREICGQNALGVVAQAGYTRTNPLPLLANTDIYLTDGLLPYAVTLTWTNPGPCDVAVIPQVDFGIQGVGMPLNSQSAPSRIEYRVSINGGPYTAWVAVPFIPTMTSPNGWEGETKTGFLDMITVPAGGTLTMSQLCFIRSSVAATLATVTAGIRFWGWVVT